MIASRCSPFYVAKPARKKSPRCSNAPECATNRYAGVQYIVVRQDGADRWAEVARELPALPLEFHPATRVLADVAAGFKARHKLSLADAFAAALAKERKAELVTGDPEFKPLEKEIKIVWLR